MSDWQSPNSGLPGEEQGEQSKKILAGFQPGERIGRRYEVLKVLGRGGMGVVYLVEDRKTKRHVALKTLLPEYSERARAVKRFEREVDTARKLNHPCIVKIYDAWRVENLLLYTMEYVEGRSLRDLLRKREQFGLGSTVRILSMVCHALEHAHAIMVHRDISPDNVMVQPNGKVKLLDFGLAKQVDGQQGFTMIGANLGKIDYNAPEQQANATEVDGRADLYSLGVMFYEMLTGQVPRGRATKPLSELRPDLPWECETFLARAMARDREDRFPDARAFRHGLRDLYQIYESRRDQAAPDHEDAEENDGRSFRPFLTGRMFWNRMVRWLRIRRGKSTV